jgi:hypothetical protein
MPEFLTTWEAEIRSSLWPAQGNTSQDPISKITRVKWWIGSPKFKPESYK